MEQHQAGVNVQQRQTAAPLVLADSTPFAVLTWVGEVLIIQLLFVVAAAPLVTALPAAFALQRSLHDVLRGDASRPAAVFVTNLRWALRRFWLVGVLLTVGLAAGVAAWLFWSSVDTSWRWVGLGVLAGLGGTVMVGYVAALAAVTRSPVAARRHDVTTAAAELIHRRPAQLIAAVAAITGWTLVMLHVPTLVLIGSGLVPAAITWFLVAHSAAAQGRTQRVTPSVGGRR